MVKKSSGRTLNPADIARKKERKKELKKNAENRKTNRELASKRADPKTLEEEIRTLGLRLLFHESLYLLLE